MNEPLASFVISAPSGAGKTTLTKALLERTERLTRVITCTTRSARPNERHEDDYFFLDVTTFERKRDDGELLEWAEVHGKLYGTPRSEVERIHGAGDDAVLVIDVQGAAALRDVLTDSISIYVLPPSRETLAARLTGRDGTDASTRRRLQVAGSEIAQYVDYDYVVINDDFETAMCDLSAIVRAERCRRHRRAAVSEVIRASFSTEAATETKS